MTKISGELDYVLIMVTNQDGLKTLLPASRGYVLAYSAVCNKKF